MIRAIPAFQDNYIWIIESKAAASVIVVDPGDAVPVIAWLKQHQRKLAAILITHHHHDHTGGIGALLEFATQSQQEIVTVFGPAQESIPGVSHQVREGDLITIPATQHQFRVIEVPGHTRGHIAYVAERSDNPDFQHPVLFCGDTLFAAGCGRLFEGTAAQMFNSLKKLAALPPDTEVYCTHEYTLANLRFAVAAFPGDPAINERFHQVQAQRTEGQITLPSAIAIELRTNPFLLCQTAEEFRRLRQQKDEFRG